MAPSRVDILLMMLLLSLLTVAAESGGRIVSPKRDFAYSSSVMPVLYALAVMLIAGNFYAFVLPSFRPYAYADDWIFATPLDFNSLSEWMNWLFTQHVDHRIPIQKLVSYLVLRASGFDFRAMVALNYAMAIVVSAMLLDVAKLYRGFLSAGDMIIPLAILHFSNGHSLWGFQFAFIAPIFFFAAFVLFAVRRSTNWAAAALIGCAWCGIHGVIFATCGTVAVLVWMAVSGERKGIIAFGVALLNALALWFTWKPSAAAGLSLSLREFGRYMYGLLPASMGVFAFNDSGWKFLTVLALFVVSVAIVLWKLFRREATFDDYLLAVGALSSFVVMTAVALGRSKVQGEWNSVIAMHYGSMSLFMPTLGWLIISKRFPRSGGIIGIILLGVYLNAWLVDSEWRDSVIDSAVPRQVEIVKDMRNGKSPTVLADKYASDFTVDSPQNRADVAKGIETFRVAGAKLYGGQ